MNFERSIYHQLVQYDNAQETTLLLSVELTRELYDNESISSSRIVGDKVSSKFLFNETSLSVLNLSPLVPGEYQFSLVLVVMNKLSGNSSFLSCSAVLYILSPSEF